MTRKLDDIEKAFREMGLNETTWGRQESPTIDPPAQPGAPEREQLFIRIETTTTPLETKPIADLA